LIKRVLPYFLIIFVVIATGIYPHIIPEDGFAFLEHPQWASWFLGSFVLLLPMIIFLSYQLLKVYKSYLNTQESVFSMMEIHQHTRQMHSEKSHFLATISHEIRNPLQAILGTHELLLKDLSLKKESKYLIQGAYNTSKSLLDMLNQVLDLSKIESGKISLIYEPVSLRELLIHLTQSFEGLCKARSNVLKLHLDPVLAQSLLIDCTRLNQVLANLISNSIKFTQNGLIYVSVNVLNDTHAEQFLQFQVIDTGCGIPDEDIERIIEPYERSIGFHQHAVPGNGLGLSISSAILASMNSQLHIDSKLSLGTSASFKVRLKRSSSLPISHHIDLLKPKLDFELGHFLGKTALIVDDYPACREIISQQLSHLGFMCIQACHAEEGFSLLEKRTVDLVITDEFMPEITGRQFVQMIKRDHPRIKIIILTGDTQFASKLSSAEVGMIHAFMIKPIELNDFYQTLVQVFTDDQLHWDFNRLLEFTNNNAFDAYDILRSILQTQHELALEVEEHLLQMDISTLASLCHKVSSGAKLIDAHLLIQYCQIIQNTPAVISPVHIRHVYEELLLLNKLIQDFLDFHNSDII
jgi:two-component system sensor histidine kinase EvgS